MQQAETIFKLMRPLVHASTRVARMRLRNNAYLYPHHDERCFCRGWKKCACANGFTDSFTGDDCCVVCAEPRTCNCVVEPMKLHLGMVETVPDKVEIASKALMMLRFVSHDAYRAYKAYMRAHLGLLALISEYRVSSLSIAMVDARETVVGRRVGCCVATCSRCHGNIHECNCSMFTCKCKVCVWSRHVMCDPVVPGEVVPLIDDDYRGDKPQRFSVRALSCKPARDKRSDQLLQIRHVTRRRCSYERYLRRTPEVTAARQLQRLSMGLEIFDEGLDSDVHPDDAA